MSKRPGDFFAFGAIAVLMFQQACDAGQTALLVAALLGGWAINESYKGGA